MSEIDYTIERSSISATHSCAMVLDGENASEALLEDVWQTIWIDVELTIGGVTMFAAAWSDPEHWSDDWREKLDCEHDEVPDRVADLIAEATTS